MYFIEFLLGRLEAQLHWPPPSSYVALFTCSHNWDCGTELVTCSRNEVCGEVGSHVKSQLPVDPHSARRCVTFSECVETLHALSPCLGVWYLLQTECPCCSQIPVLKPYPKSDGIRKWLELGAVMRMEPHKWGLVPFKSRERDASCLCLPPCEDATRRQQSASQQNSTMISDIQPPEL